MSLQSSSSPSVFSTPENLPAPLLNNRQSRPATKPSVHAVEGAAMINVWRRLSILGRLLLGFSITIAVIMSGFVLAGYQLTKARHQLTQIALPETVLQALNQAEMIYWCALLVGLLFGGVLIVLVTISMVAPLARLKAAADCMGAGDLTQAYDTQHTDEAGKMARAFANVSHHMSQVVRAIQASCQEMEHATSDLTHDSAQLSQRTDSSSVRLQECTSAMAQMTAMSLQSSECASRAAALSAEVGMTSEKSTAALHEVGSTVARIDRSFQQMTSIISIVDAIAFQTNILALNASVEAAHAGRAGAGFTLVAAEVRTLAARTTEAAKEVSCMMQEAANIAAICSRQTHHAADVMQEVSSKVEHLQQHVAAITHAASEQQGAIQAVALAVQELETTTTQNATLAETVVVATSNLRRQTGLLTAAVAGFQVSA